jgi:small-conductance mechanosensitive channel
MDFQTIFQEWLSSFFLFLPKLIAGIVIFILAIVGSGFIGKWIKKIIRRKTDNEEMLHLVFLITKWSVIVFGTILALSQVNFDVTGFIAGLGVAGFTIGFALQDIAKNFISGLLLLSRQPFKMGDYVSVSDHEGTVREINVRDTVIETLDGELIIIPNKDVLENPIINSTDSRYRRGRVQIGLGYEEDADRATEIFTESIKSVPGVAQEKDVIIRADGLGDSSLSMSALFWVDQKEHNLVQVQSDVIKAIKVTSEKHQINLPYPVQTILLQRQDE